jgi:hypothetical protein
LKVKPSHNETIQDKAKQKQKLKIQKSVRTKVP